jgi:DNA-binding MarR family transcriptional regulator
MRLEQSPSGGWRLCQQIMQRCKPTTDQEQAVLRRLSESGSQSIQALRESVNTADESLYQTVSRLEDKGFAVVHDSQQIKITENGCEALQMLGSRGGSR